MASNSGSGNFGLFVKSLFVLSKVIYSLLNVCRLLICINDCIFRGAIVEMLYICLEERLREITLITEGFFELKGL